MKWGLITLVILSACTSAETPAQKIYEIESDYASVLKLAVTYEKLPVCDSITKTHLCADPKIIKQIKEADIIAWSILREAQNAVRTPGFGDSKTTKAIASAHHAVIALADIVDHLGVR